MDTLTIDRIAFFISLFLSLILTVFHYQVMSLWAGRLAKAKKISQLQIATTMLIVIMSNFLSALVYAVFYFILHQKLHTGGFVGLENFHIRDYFYYSLTVYTSLGFGDIYPTGSIRILSALETLNGLVMIAWSSSYSYLIMSNYFKQQDAD